MSDKKPKPEKPAKHDTEPWLDWQPMSTFPRDGNAYLVWDDRILDGDPEVVFWDEDFGRHLATSNGPRYHVEAFTHWARIPGPQR